MPKIVQKTVYSFEELGDVAKERARDWWRSCIECDELADYDHWTEVAKILGIEFKQVAVRLMGGGTRYEPVIHWSGFSSQGDGACFQGTYSYAKGCSKAIRKYMPTDTVLHRIADDLAAVQRQHGYKLTARIGRNTFSSNYCHSHTMDIELYRDGDNFNGPGYDTMAQAMRDFADWIYSCLQANWESLNSDEQVDDSIIVNGYDFEADGRRAL